MTPLVVRLLALRFVGGLQRAISRALGPSTGPCSLCDATATDEHPVGPLFQLPLALERRGIRGVLYFVDRDTGDPREVCETCAGALLARFVEALEGPGDDA